MNIIDKARVAALLVMGGLLSLSCSGISEARQDAAVPPQQITPSARATPTPVPSPDIKTPPESMARKPVAEGEGVSQPIEMPPTFRLGANGDLTRADRRQLCAVLEWTDDCTEKHLPESAAWSSLTSYELASGQRLVAVMTNLGAYNPDYIYYHLDEARTPATARLLSFEDYVSDEVNGKATLTARRTTEVSGMPEFDAKRKELVIYDKHRGAGGCGDLATYSFHNGEPLLREFRTHGCDEEPQQVDPRKWKKVRIAAH